MFCFHKWEEKGRLYTAATANPESFTVKGPTDDVRKIYRELFFGITTIEQRCTKCGLIRFDSIPGVIGNV